MVGVLDGFHAHAPGWTTERILRRFHYAPWGNELVAKVLARELAARKLAKAAPTAPIVP